VTPATKQPPLPLVLASSSRYRAELLNKLAIPFTTCAANLDESAQPGETAKQLVQRLALGKAQAVANQPPQALIIGSDQVACLNRGAGEDILGKPGTPEKAEQQLAKLAGQRVTFYTSLCLLRSSDGSTQQGLDATHVSFRDLSTSTITDYVARENPLDCAGAFKSEALGIALFSQLETQDPNALIGLPLILLCTYLANWGQPVLAP